MASIKGVTLKAIKNNRGHDGEVVVSANIYIDNKKAGTYEEDSWGGHSLIKFDTPELQEKFEERKEAYFAETPDLFPTAETMISDILKNIELEKVFKKRWKEGYVITARFEFRKRPVSINEIDQPVKLGQIWSFGSEEQLQLKLDEEKPVVATIVREVKDLVL